MDIINVVDRLDALVNTSGKMPGTHSRLVDPDKVMELLEQLRLSIPQDVRAAQEVIDRKDTILNQAQIDARHTRNDAEEEFRIRLDEHELMVAARSKADRMVEEAEGKANRLIEHAEAQSKTSRAEADAYVIQALRGMEKELTSVLTAVRNGLEVLGAKVPA